MPHEVLAKNKRKASIGKQRCNGLCLRFEAQGKVENFRYLAGQKRCSTCQVYMVTKKTRCPCCKTTLRTKPRSKRIWNQLGKIPELKIISGERF